MPYTDEEKKQHIKELQGYLSDISYINPNIPRVIPDGIYGSETAAAVSAFQNAYGLPVTGTADENTWYEIYKQHINARNYLNEPSAIQVFPFNEYIITVGSSGTAVAMVQIMLNELAGLYVNLLPQKITGSFDNSNKRAVEQIQKIWGTEPTGEIDIATWNNITDTFNYHFPQIFENEIIMPL